MKKKVDDDEAIVVDLSRLPADVWAVLFFVKLPNLVSWLVCARVSASCVCPPFRAEPAGFTEGIG